MAARRNYARKKDKRRRHAKTRKAEREALATPAEQPRRVAGQSRDR